MFVRLSLPLAKYPMNHQTDLIETFRKLLLGGYSLINIWSQPDSNESHSKSILVNKNGCNSVSLTYIELRSGVVVAVTDLQHVL